jgi:hypothetical protein
MDSTHTRLTNEIQASEDLVILFKYWKNMKDIVEQLHVRYFSSEIQSLNLFPEQTCYASYRDGD